MSELHYIKEERLLNENILTKLSLFSATAKSRIGHPTFWYFLHLIVVIGTLIYCLSTCALNLMIQTSAYSYGYFGELPV